MLPQETDKIFINPRLWRKWGEQVQNSFIEWANIGELNFYQIHYFLQLH